MDYSFPTYILTFHYVDGRKMDFHNMDSHRIIYRWKEIVEIANNPSCKKVTIHFVEHNMDIPV